MCDSALFNLINGVNSSVRLLRDRVRPLEAIVVGLEEQLLGVGSEVGCVDGGEVDAPRVGGGDHPVHNVKHLQQVTG